MSILVVADVHANLAAFEAVIASASQHAPIEGIWSLGDVVGYGPQPRECLELLRSHPHVAIAGNHDLAAAELIDTHGFNPVAAEAAAWTAEQLTVADREYIEAMPLSVMEAEFTLVHGSLIDPVWEYLVSDIVARGHFSAQTTPYALVGHSHFPLLFPEDGEGAPAGEGMRISLGDRRFVANPGSVGQPRDGDGRAAYALLDTTTRVLSFHRVEYGAEATRALILAAGLPAYLGDRLLAGR